ncbi:MULTISPECIES: bifunctional DNA-formamidopyrimidine glycosylase/DNA-(apurinic or apyrimidinic site) lyase [Arthrobacter]|uniref:Bifunctional DNA-formamidopyrimidine glycosylase/DNA-(Apurinic or apyrimidinic site) lyase n=2 Tax=Arthrobacter TaxID=1663 RepID=A0ABU9KGS3_9MICC|nr:bifunctional DNA-formamidopyrimidine glycosylase/DNA-(apurinic or apyrimidinic site) lyase [Arthrobacter sp. YJM1]MDP5225558.1 bifunctional DNA-formamidopyrimidine glycosylase/DNA-(apurinic or apyrimidinic site) lyase [Arthrobacter sp. YJM1]
MPELPEVEVVRSGLERWAVGRRITDARVLDTRSVRRHDGGAGHFEQALDGALISGAVRRGKYLWLLLDTPGSDAPGPFPGTALLAHLGMSGQLLMEDPSATDEKHLKVRLSLSPSPGKPDELRFVDQRIFGGLSVTSMVPTLDGLPGGLGSEAPLLPQEVSGIARDLLDPHFDPDAVHDVLHRRKSTVKRSLLDQNLLSGVGNIYADEALWAARLHGERPTNTLRRPETLRLLEAARDVMERALAAGGTSFDSLYVNVNGASGYFSRSLNAYGREGEPCLRCAAEGRQTLIRRASFMNRSSYFCPKCQPVPRKR